MALVVFADVEDVDGSPTEESDAWSIVRRAITREMGEFDGRIFQVSISGHLMNVRLHDAIEVGIAAGNGYLWIRPTIKAFRQYNWQED